MFCQVLSQFWATLSNFQGMARTAIGHKVHVWSLLYEHALLCFVYIYSL